MNPQVPPGRKYNFKAKAVAVAGRLVRPVSYEVGDLVLSELAGGDGTYRTSRLENYRFREFFSFRAAYTSVTGSEGPDRHFNTLAIATIEKLNVLDILTADRITARLAGLHPEDDFLEPPWIIPLGSEIVNLRVAGREVKPHYPASFQLDPKAPASYRGWVDGKRQNDESDGDELEVPRFGRVTCCRLRVATDHTHQLAMLTLHLGSPVDGELTFAAVDADGSPPHGG